MKTLIVEDDLTSRIALQRLLSEYGDCDIAVDGQEALEAFALAVKEQRAYDLICLDITMPCVDGHAALKGIRAQEKAQGIRPYNRAKIIMTTSRHDKPAVMRSIESECDAYIIKPVGRQRLLEKLCSIGLLEDRAWTLAIGLEEESEAQKAEDCGSGERNQKEETGR
ncbi:response regulator [Candidatus Hydrogenedentota bacterium]